jgi:hypothetical protein
MLKGIKKEGQIWPSVEDLLVLHLYPHMLTPVTEPEITSGGGVDPYGRAATPLASTS